MRNYIILNDVNSNTINGLLIQELPPISKPKMRTQIEEIDGRAGDIVTQLGYAAYTKTISVGLYGDFDINEVISYFNSAGTVVFSNEPDKYYNYEIIDQIDFNRLVRFRTAKVKMHVQPFKYPTEEEPLVAQYQLVTNTGSDMSLNNTANALFRKINPMGNTTQDGTPTPSSPIPINVVSGDNEISICGKNLLITNVEDATTKNVSCIKNEDGTYTISGTSNASGYMELYSGPDFKIPPGTYTSSMNVKYPIYLRLSSGEYQELSNTSVDHKTFTFNEEKTFNRIYLYITGSGVSYNGTIKPMLEKGNQATTYEPYIGNKYPIYLGVENLFNKDNFTELNAKIDSGSIVSASAERLIVFQCKPNTTYTFTKLINTPYQRNYIGETTTSPTTGTSVSNTSSHLDTNSFSYTTSANAQYIVWWYYCTGSTAYTKQETLDSIVIEKGSKANHPSTTPIELCKIGDYQDYLYKENGTWYLHKEVGKDTISSNVLSVGTASSGIKYALVKSVSDAMANGFVYCEKYINNSDATQNNAIRLASTSLYVYDNTFTSTTIASNSLNGLEYYYPLATPTINPITDEDLIAQLEATKQANSYDGQTNISHQYNGSPFILDVAAVQKGTDTLVINNEGNIYARPTLDIEGTGMVNVYLEGNQMFQVDLSENNEIVIDTDEMEAYDPSTQALMNRQVTGNYDNFKIVAGNNNLKFSGDLTKATVTGYERWL